MFQLNENYHEILYSSPVYFFQPTARGCLQNQLSSSVDRCCTKRWVYPSDSMIYRLKLERFTTPNCFLGSFQFVCLNTF